MKSEFLHFICIYFLSLPDTLETPLWWVYFVNWEVKRLTLVFCTWRLPPPLRLLCHLLQILERLNKMCSSGVWKKQQRLLKNMGAHKVMLDLLQVSYDQVRPVPTKVKASQQVHSPVSDWFLVLCVFRMLLLFVIDYYLGNVIKTSRLFILKRQKIPC